MFHTISLYIGFLTSCRMTVVQAFIANTLYREKLPSLEDIPDLMCNTLVEAIVLNSSYTSKILVCTLKINFVFHKSKPVVY